MSAQGLTAKLQQTEKEKLSFLQRNWPELTEQLSLSLMSPKQAVTTTSSSESRPLLEEEYQQLLQLVRAQASLPPQAIPKDQHTLFQTAMSDWLGFSVTLMPDGVDHIPYHSGKIRALQYPAVSANFDRFVPEAGVSKTALTWNKPGETIDIEHMLYVHPNFLVGLPGGMTARPWFVGKSAVLIDPLSLTTTIAVIVDVLPEQSARYQFGAAPGLIRQNYWWTPTNPGTVLVFYTDESILPGTQFTRSAS